MVVVELPLIFSLKQDFPYFTVCAHVLYISICERTASNCVFLLAIQFLPGISAWFSHSSLPFLPLKPRTTIYSWGKAISFYKRSLEGGK